MRFAEIVEVSDKVHASRDRFGFLRLTSNTANKLMASGAKSGVYPLYIRRTDFATLAQKRCQKLRLSLNQTFVDPDDMTALILFDHLGDDDVLPFDQSGATAFPSMLRIAESSLPNLDISAETVRNQQDWSFDRTTFDLIGEFLQHVLIASRGNDPAQPESGVGAYRHRHPDDFPFLKFDVHLVGLHLLEIHLALNDFLFMELFAMFARLFLPAFDSSFIHEESIHDRLEWAAECQQREHEHEQDYFGGILFSVEESPLGGAKSFAASDAFETVAVDVMVNNISTILFSS